MLLMSTIVYNLGGLDKVILTKIIVEVTFNEVFKTALPDGPIAIV